MKQTAKRQKNYEATKEGWIHIYPSMEEREGRRIFGEIAALLRSATKNLISLIRRGQRFGSLGQGKRN